MGSRHQLFIIARIRPAGESNKSYYYCLVHIHHQSLSGTGPLKAVLTFINLIKQPENARVVRQELQAAHNKYHRWFEEIEVDPYNPRTPCPFLAY
ncbi:hypothetical protein SISSUDRAFT_963726, partial [Sistotremastrum suecicum HHB10207 ss-3]